ncbi:hypothetical protein F5Y14DRAFT_383264 [Nemania sp. NC0429]|nr:hypothetical protein F5Y14DRAFT_383264 [Nemania sp. NC0429]
MTANLGLGEAYLGTPLTDTFKQSVIKGAKGGSDTVHYYNKVNTFAEMLKNASIQGMDAWTESVDANGLPIYYLTEDDGYGNTFYAEIHYKGVTVEGEGENRKLVTNKNSQTINGKNYDGIGYKAFTFTYNEVPYGQWLWYVGIGTGTTALLSVAAPLLKGVIKSFTQNFTTQLRSFGSLSTTNASEIDDMIEMSEREIGESIAEEVGVDVAAEVAVADVAMSTLGFCGVGLAVAAVCIVLAFVLHSSHQQLILWNFSRYKLMWEVDFYEGAFMQCPGKIDQDGKMLQNFAIDAVKKTAPPDDANPSWKAYHGDFSIDSQSEIHGIGYAIQLKFVDENLKEPTDADVKYKCTFMYDIPWTGSNSTAVTFDDITDLKKFYKDNEGKHKSTQQTATSHDGVITVSTTYDFLEGKHKIPGQSNTGYFYQSLVTVTDTGA